MAAITAIILSAVVFGLAHLPSLALHASLDSAIILRTVLLNALAGIVYGMLYLQLHLEAAIVAHISTHLGFWLLANFF